MAEGLVLTDLDNVDAHRTAIVEDLSSILEAAGADEQAYQYRQGQHDAVVAWVKTEVSMGMHGFQQGKYGVPVENEPELNVLAQNHDLIGPVRLWKNGDDIPEGRSPGHIREYKVVADPSSLTAEVLRSSAFVGQGATHDGMMGRIDSTLQAAAHSEVAKQGGIPEVVILTGMRRTEPREGKTGLYLGTLPPNADPTKPIEDVHLTETDSAIAILQSRCRKFELIEEIGDPNKDHKPADRIHPELGGRIWIARRYAAELTEDRGGKKVTVTVVNGEPILTPERLNAGKTPAPLAVETLRDWLGIVESDAQLDVSLGVTYTHLARIGSELLRQSQAAGRPLGRISLLGNMPQQPTWDRTEVDQRTGRLVHNGASLVLGEVIPQIKAFNGLLVRPEFDLSL